MALPPRTFGERNHEVRIRRAGAGWTVTVDGRTLAPTFPSQVAALAAGAEERLRLDATAGAILRRIRRGLGRKQ